MYFVKYKQEIEALHAEFILNMSSGLASQWCGVSWVACQPSDINGCNFDVYVMCRGKSSVSFMAGASLSKENNPRAHRYAYNCGIRRRSGLHVVRRRAQRALGPFRTRGRETDWQTDREREIYCLVAMEMKAHCSYSTTRPIISFDWYCTQNTNTNIPTHRYTVHTKPQKPQTTHVVQAYMSVMHL